MSANSSAPSSLAHRELPDVRPRMAKADLRKADVPDLRKAIGIAIRNTAGGLGWNLDQLAGALKRDPRQVSRWLDGTERPHFDLLFGVPELKEPLGFALLKLVGAIVTTNARSAA